MLDNLEISPVDLAAMQERKEAFTLIDVREDWEWEYNRIPGATHLPLDQIEARHESELDRGGEIILYCHSGMRSLQAAVWLRQLGYAKARSLAGGIDRWANDVSPEMPRY